MELHERIREIRKRKGFKQDYVARRIGYKLSMYNAIEMGHRQLKASLLSRLADALEVEPSIFFTQDFHETWNTVERGDSNKNVGEAPTDIGL